MGVRGGVEVISLTGATVENVVPTLQGSETC